jgi:hypothetical protein
MDNANRVFYDQLRTVPRTALRTIAAGRLKGKSDINPQWRIERMTEVFGACGVGWYYEPITQEVIPMGDELMVRVNIHVYIKDGDEWSKPVFGTGGAMLYEKQRNGMYSNDEAFKMATTDALSVAFKQLGVAADVYRGMMDGSKYQDTSNEALMSEYASAVSAMVATCTDKDELAALSKRCKTLHSNAQLMAQFRARFNELTEQEKNENNEVADEN